MSQFRASACASLLSALLLQTALSAAENNPAAQTQAVTTPEAIKPCFKCNGIGKVKCVGGCRSGEVDCPNSCLKLSRGVWHPEAGHDPKVLWQTFPAGENSKVSWSQAHVGELIQIQGGIAVNLGRCPTCKGTTKIKCTVCKGAGEIDCDICEGKKIVPASWSPLNNPKSKEKADVIHLKDGKTVSGKIIMRSDTVIWVRTESGEKIEINRAKVAP
jgi:hypothetical protein